MSDLTPDRLAELRLIAEAATPGPWAVNPTKAQIDDMNTLVPICALLWPTDLRTEEQTLANGEYIAAFDPPTVLALLERILDLEHRLIYYEPDMYVQRCTVCHGRGRREYPDTSTWRGGGYAGQAITTDICDKCWGTGDEGRPGTDLRAMVQRHREYVDKAIDVAVHTALTMAADSRGPVDLWSLHEAAVRRAKERLTDPNLEIEKRGAQT